MPYEWCNRWEEQEADGGGSWREKEGEEHCRLQDVALSEMAVKLKQDEEYGQGLRERMMSAGYEMKGEDWMKDLMGYLGGFVRYGGLETWRLVRELAEFRE